MELSSLVVSAIAAAIFTQATLHHREKSKICQDKMETLLLSLLELRSINVKRKSATSVPQFKALGEEMAALLNKAKVIIAVYFDHYTPFVKEVEAMNSLVIPSLDLSTGSDGSLLSDQVKKAAAIADKTLKEALDRLLAERHYNLMTGWYFYRSFLEVPFLRKKIPASILTISIDEVGRVADFEMNEKAEAKGTARNAMPPES